MRTKDNIARVRRDEAKAAAEHKERATRAVRAEREAALAALRGALPPPPLAGPAPAPLPNKEHERQAKEEKEKYEKQIGYLTYLGQDTNEALGKKNWYDEVPDRPRPEDPELITKDKPTHDPLTGIKRTLALPSQRSTSKVSLPVLKPSVITDIMKKTANKESSRSKKHLKKKKKKRSRRSSTSSDNESGGKAGMDELRRARLLREAVEREREAALLRGPAPPSPPPPVPTTHTRKYNSQFNPELAKQNYNNKY